MAAQLEAHWFYELRHQTILKAIRDALGAFGIEKDILLPSPCTGEAVKMLIVNG